MGLSLKASPFVYLKLRGDTVVPQLSSLGLSSLDNQSRIEATSVHLPFICSSLPSIGTEVPLIILCKKESQLQSKKTDFSQEKSRKSQIF